MRWSDRPCQHWELVLSALSNNNLILTARKVRFFPHQTEVFGWKYHLDGSITPSDHVLNNLGHTDIATLRTVKSVNSWRGLYKTLLPALPNLASIMDPSIWKGNCATADLRSQGIFLDLWHSCRIHHSPRTPQAQTPPCIGWYLFVLWQVNGITTPILV